jgi:hypothetical protein
MAVLTQFGLIAGNAIGSSTSHRFPRLACALTGRAARRPVSICDWPRSVTSLIGQIGFIGLPALKSAENRRAGRWRLIKASLELGGKTR